MVGLMGVGKTTIGRVLAQELRLDFVDCDEEIERRSGVRIPWIFDVEGEARFREREARVLDDLTGRDHCLVATGGGAVLNAENRKLLKARGIVVYLDADIDLLVRRTEKSGDQRPLLRRTDADNPQDPKTRVVLETMKQARDPLYREVADIQVLVDNLQYKATARQVLEELEQAGFVADMPAVTNSPVAD